MSQTTDTITTAAIAGAMEQTYQAIGGLLNQLSDPLSETPDEGGWTVRQLLSHLAGAFWRVPVHGGFILGGQNEIPISMHNFYWISEWETAPVAAFRAAIDAGYQGVRSFLATVDEAALDRPIVTPIGDMPFGQFLMISVAGHIGRFHLGQLQAFVEAH